MASGQTDGHVYWGFAPTASNPPSVLYLRHIYLDRVSYGIGKYLVRRRPFLSPVRSGTENNYQDMKYGAVSPLSDPMRGGYGSQVCLDSSKIDLQKKLEIMPLGCKFFNSASQEGSY